VVKVSLKANDDVGAGGWRMKKVTTVVASTNYLYNLAMDEAAEVGVKNLGFEVDGEFMAAFT